MTEQNNSDFEKNNILIKARKHIEITGVREVSSFDDREVVMNTYGGELSLEGENLKIGILDTDRGIVTVDGKICAVSYYDNSSSEKRGFFGRKNK